MSAAFALLLMLSLTAMVGELAYRLVTRNARVVPRLIAVLVAAVVIYALPGRVEKMGSASETASIVICYAAMLLGMMAEYGYAQAERGQTKFTFEGLTFFMPIFASPIVFIPLLTLTSELGAGGAFTRARVMVYLVAFQNGFFWKIFFEQRQKQIRGIAASTDHASAARSG
jgi:hypothetical protein